MLLVSFCPSGNHVTDDHHHTVRTPFTLTRFSCLRAAPDTFCVQIVLSFGNRSSVSVSHDASAEKMMAAIESLAHESLDGFLGRIDVSREANGAEGLQAYRCRHNEGTESLANTRHILSITIGLKPLLPWS